MNSIPEENTKDIKVEETINMNKVLKGIQYGSTYQKDFCKLYLIGKDKDIVLNYLMENKRIITEEKVSEGTYIIKSSKINDNELCMLSSYDITIIVIEDDTIDVFYDGEKSICQIFMFDIGFYVHLITHLKDLNFAEILLIYMMLRLDSYDIEDMKTFINSKLFDSMKTKMRDAYGFEVNIDIHIEILNFLIHKKLLHKFQNLHVNQVKEIIPRGNVYG